MIRWAGAALWVCVGLGTVSPWLPDAYGKRSNEFVFDRLNRTYHDVAPGMSPIRRGPLTIRLSSPRHAITLREHHLELEPQGDGLHSMRLEAEFNGAGDLVADLDLAGLQNRLEDKVIIPVQRKSIDGRVRLERDEGGYSVIPVTMPASVELEIRSGLAKRLVNWCDQVSWLSMNILDCRGLDRQLSTVSFPVPQGGTYFLSDADLTPQEHEQVRAYLQSSERG